MSPRRTGENDREALGSLAALLLLSLLWTFPLLRADLLPDLGFNMLPYFEGQVLPLAMLALAAGSIAVLRGARWPQRRAIRGSIWVGLGLFAAPAGLTYLSGVWVSGSARTALLTLVPLFAVIFAPYIGSSSRPQSRGGLLAALTAVAGALFVFPIAIPASAEAGMGMVAVILAAAFIGAANCLGVAHAAEENGNSGGQIAPMAAIVAGSAAVLLAAGSAILERTVWKWESVAPELLWSAAIKVPALFLLFWLMRRMSAPRMATRYVLAPLLAILIGTVLLRSFAELRVQTWVGLILMTSGAGWILLSSREKSGPPIASLDLKP